MAATDPNPPSAIVVFDGVCPYCVGWVRRLIHLDRRGLLRFAPKQTPAARAALESCGVDPDAVESIVLLRHGRVLLRSDAALGIVALLPPPWSLGRIARWVPRGLRDGVYAWVARNRFRWFGRREQCYVPAPGERARFLR